MVLIVRALRLLSKANTEFAHTTPVPGTESWIDELRMLTKRRYDHGGDREEGNAYRNLEKSPLYLSIVGLKEGFKVNLTADDESFPATTINRKLFERDNRVDHIQNHCLL